MTKSDEFNIGSQAIAKLHEILSQSFTPEQAADIITAIVVSELWREPIMSAWNAVRTTLSEEQNKTEEVPGDKGL